MAQLGAIGIGPHNLGEGLAIGTSLRADRPDHPAMRDQQGRVLCLTGLLLAV
jgi:hypothetical protein